MALQKDEVGAADASGVAGAQPVTKDWVTATSSH